SSSYRRPLSYGRPCTMSFPDLPRPQQRGVLLPQTNGLRCTPLLRPHLEILEDRLPPGDVVFGGLLTDPLTGPGLVDRDFLTLPPAGSADAGLAATHWPFRRYD